MNNKTAGKKAPAKRAEVINEKKTKKPVNSYLPYKQIIPFVQSEMASDDGYKERDNILIQTTYQNANDIQQALIDDIFICLCGYSMKTIINNADVLEEEDD